MSSLTNDIIINAPAGRVWEIVAHRFDRIGDWATAIPSSTAITTSGIVDAPVAGRVCQTTVRAVPEVTETIVAYDEHARTLTYEATAGLPGFVRVARNTWQVIPFGDGRAKVSYQAQIEVAGLLGRAALRLLLARVARDGRHLLDDLRHYAEHGEPSPRKQAPAADPVAAVGVWPSTRRLRSAVRANAVFSMVSGLLLVVAGWFAPGLGPAFAPPLVGVGVAVFGVLLARVAVSPARELIRSAISVVIADVLWVAGSVVLLILYPVPLASRIAVTAVAVIVAGLACWQLAGLAATRRGDPLADFEIVEATRVLPVVPQQVWPVLTDHQLYGRLAPNLSTVEVISAPDETLRRRCTNTSGQHWQETCTVWQEGSRFAVAVDTNDYPYPLASVRGLWQVDPYPGGSRVTIRFAYQARQTFHGGFFALALGRPMRSAVRRIFDGWQTASRKNVAA